MCPVLLRYSPNYVTDLSYNTVRDTGSLGDNATARSRGGGEGCKVADRAAVWVQKVGQAAAAGTAAGSYLQLQGHLAYQAAPAQGGMVPVYPFYHYPYHASHSQGLGVPAAHFLPPVSAAAVVSSKPTVVATPKGRQHIIVQHLNLYKRNTSHMCNRCGATRAAQLCMCSVCHGISAGPGRAKLACMNAWQAHATKH
jgi:hypothetical protein